MALLKISKYWLYQCIGWGINMAVSIFIMLSMEKTSFTYFKSLLATVIVGIAITHVMRWQMQKFQILAHPIKGQIWRMLIVTVVFAFVFGIASLLIDYAVGEVFPERFAKLSFIMKFEEFFLICSLVLKEPQT